jgi:membrane complex biogenesis BtpA family protein
MKLLARDKPLIGVVHLLPLPGAPRARPGGLDEVLERALADANALSAGGVDAAIVENFGDAPFLPLVPPETTAAMAVLIRELRQRTSLPFGVNVLRNDGAAALGIAAVTGAAFIRVNVFCGTALTDSGPIEGHPRALLAVRRRLGIEATILADIHVKHAAHFNSLEEAAIDATRNGADALIVTGEATGHPLMPGDLHRAKEATGLRVLVGSGLTAETIGAFAEADGFIVGSALHRNGDILQPVDAVRVAEVAGAAARLRGA